MQDLKEKEILITGATSPIGKKIAKELTLGGANVTLLGRSKEKLQSLLASLPNGDNKYYCFDVTDHEELENFINESQNFDGIVHNVGLIDYTPVKSITKEKIDLVFNVNVTFPILLSSFLIKRKKVNKNASFVFISSLSAHLGVPATSLYASAKSSINSFSRVLASELASKKIRSNSISPGIILTQGIVDAGVEIEKLKENEHQYPLGYGKEIDVANLTKFLLGENSSWITGQDFIIDGGFKLK